MTNTDGGYVSFANNSVSVTQCKNYAEMEQSGIVLPKGAHTVRGELEGDMKLFAFKSNDQRMFDEEKNIIKDGKITLDSADEIILKIKGKNGSAKNLQITDKETDEYVPSVDGAIKTEPSYVEVNINNIMDVS